MVFWVITPCSDVIGYQHFRGSSCLHLQGQVNGTGKGGIVHAGKQEMRKMVALKVGKEQGSLLDQATYRYK